MRKIRLGALSIGTSLLLLGCTGHSDVARTTIEGAPANHEGQRTIRINRLEGPPVEVPLTGPLATDKVRRAVALIKEIDTRLANWSLSTSGDTEVKDAMKRVAVESREDAVDELDRALTIARTTSGPLDFLLGGTQAKADDAIKVLNSPPPMSVLCRTEITALPEGAFIHYMSEGDYKEKKNEWASYTLGQRVAIGRYRFRVTKDRLDYKELVLVISDPDVHHLQPPPD